MGDEQRSSGRDILVCSVHETSHLIAGLGAICYNIVHSYVLPLTLALFGAIAGRPLALYLVLIWGAHIGFDRVLGYGLKYPTAFKDTHLQHV